MCPAGTVRSAGAGLSDCSTAGERLDLAAPALDVKPVLEACDAGAAVLFGVTFRRPVCGSYPDRAQALVLAGGFAKMTRLGEFDFEAGPARVDEWASVIARVWSWAMMFGGGACIDCPSREPGVSAETPGSPSAAR